jgi:carboxyl-terminal processing protease
VIVKSVGWQNANMTPEDRAREKAKKFPEFGSEEDFMLSQARAFLTGREVIKSKSKLE